MAHSIPPIGIDFGTANSCAAIYRNGRAEIVPDAEGMRVTPSIIAFTHDEELGETTPVIGHVASEMRNDRPEAQNIIFDAKRLIGMSACDAFDDTEALRCLSSYWPFKLGDDKGILQIAVPVEDYETGVVLRRETYTPLQISAAVLRRLREDIEDYLGVERGTIRRAVIAHPVYFNPDQRGEILKAARLAGFFDVDEGCLVTEPDAAFLAHHVMECDRSETSLYRALVVDCGAGGFSVGMMEADNNTLSQLAASGDNTVGGRDFDHVLFELVKVRLEKAFGEGCLSDPVAHQQLLYECERIKIGLSDMTNINLEPYLTACLPKLPLSTISPQQRQDLTSLTRHDFEQDSGPLLETIFATIQRMLNGLAGENRVSKEVYEVVLVGCASHMPMIQTGLQRMFPGKIISRRLDASRAVALGAAIWGATR